MHLQQNAIGNPCRQSLQAEQQLGPAWELQKADTPGVLDLPTWLAKTLPAGSHVGVDPFLHTIDGARKLQKALQVRLDFLKFHRTKEANVVSWHTCDLFQKICPAAVFLHALCVQQQNCQCLLRADGSNPLHRRCQHLQAGRPISFHVMTLV